jgi:hypothetical protein
MWRCYFCHCEGAFAEQYTGVVQLLYAKPGHRIGMAGSATWTARSASSPGYPDWL